MDTDQKFEQLEEVVNRLLARLNDMKIKNTELERTVRARDEEIDGLRAKLDEMTADQERIGDKVGTLLAAIEEWEKGEEGGGGTSADGGGDGGDGDGSAQGGDLFSMGG